MINLILHPILVMLLLLSGQVAAISKLLSFNSHTAREINARYRKFGDKHVTNVYKYPGPRNDGEEQGEFSYPFRFQFLDTDWEGGLSGINEFRFAVASGLYEISSNPLKKFPPATNVKQVYWDEELTLLAERPGRRYKIEGGFSKQGAPWNSEVTRFKTVATITSDNHFLHYASYIVLQFLIFTYTDPFKQYFNERIIDSYQDYSITGSPDAVHKECRTRNWVILMWAEIYAIGCGGIRYVEKRELYNTNTVCLWGPLDSSKMVGRRVYIKGPPRTKCDKDWNFLNKAFPSLCSKGGGLSTNSIGEGGFTGVKETERMEDLSTESTGSHVCNFWLLNCSCFIYILITFSSTLIDL